MQHLPFCFYWGGGVFNTTRPGYQGITSRKELVALAQPLSLASGKAGVTWKSLPALQEQGPDLLPNLPDPRIPRALPSGLGSNPVSSTL